MKKIGLLFTLAILVAFSSCKFVGNLNVEKRHYSKGFYVHANGQRNSEKPAELEAVVASNENNVSALVTSNSSNSTTVAVAETEKQIVPVASKTTNAVSKNRIYQSVVIASAVNTTKSVSSKSTSETQKRVIKKENPKKSAGGDVSDVLLIILCIFLPPVAVLLKDGIGTPFWIDLVLTLLFFLPGIIYAFYVCFAS